MRVIEGEIAVAKSHNRGRPAKTIDDLPDLFKIHKDKYECGKISQEELARRCGVSRQSIYKYFKIYDDTLGEAYTKKIVDKAKREDKKEEERLKRYGRMTYEELVVLAEKEETTVWHERISKDWTPATYELEKRRKKQEKARAKAEEPLDLSEFD